MPHPSSTQEITSTHRGGWGAQGFGVSPWGGGTSAGFVIGGQVVRRRRGWARGERLISALGSSDPVRVAKL